MSEGSQPVVVGSGGAVQCRHPPSTHIASPTLPAPPQRSLTPSHRRFPSLRSCRLICQWYKNVDKLIAAVKADGRVEVKYSTPSIYLAAKAQENLTLPLKTDDLVRPHSHCNYRELLITQSSADHLCCASLSTSVPLLFRSSRVLDRVSAPFTVSPPSRSLSFSSSLTTAPVTHLSCSFFTSRPALKRYVRAASAQLQVLRQLEIWLDRDSTATELLWQNVAVAQHHDGVSGTSKQHVVRHLTAHLSTSCQGE